MIKKTTLAISLSLLMAGCGQPQQAGQNAESQKSTIKQTSQTEQLKEIYNNYFDEQLQLNPLLATYIGDDRYNDQLPNFYSEIHRTSSLQLETRYLEQVKKINAEQLPRAERISYEIFKRNRELAIEGAQYPDHLIPINQFYNIAGQLAMLASGTSAQPFDTAEDYRAWASRMEKIPRLFDQAIENMKKGVEQDIVQPRVLIEKAIPQIEAQITEDVTESIFWRPVAELPDDIADTDAEAIRKQYRDIITNTVIPAYQKLSDYLSNEYLPETRTESFGLGQLPGGKGWYDYQIKANTSTELSADRIHKIGKDEVSRIHDEMRDIMEETEFEGDLQSFFDFMTNDEQFIYESRNEMLEDYRSLRGSVDNTVDKLFDIFPQAEYEIRKVEEFREQSASSGSYQAAPTDNSRPAIFYLNTYDLSSRPSWAKTALFLHEAAPGHHFQISIQQELEDLPKFRKFGRETAYTEGWGLYSESLGYDMGLYNDPYQRFGQLAAELWRSIRLVVDTGIHSKGWSRQQVLDYMYDNAPVAEARAVSEAERFMALPGQALAYKIGQLKISELRRDAERKLGENFDIKAFHRVVLEDGAVPLTVLERKVKRWVAQQL
ncbi:MULTISPECIES: DUF885 domain-containing protein [Idiomarina]|jgi:uncharacterized protein (DUF885 family)|uniref:Uncharacterized conserved secreted protein n=1 Tax=Idiomarina loihiensis (strain ATCC BAA-735 / DSM 15497 / L2-TR) TaxID=283942 RepID=Q5QUY9_IDILO|nr:MULTISPECIES: DUF885 domain-containing protein [Idiomarina]AAV82283.1 Uncharacterized conserved secreted protein [Idiomarina loihiensis L2TR]AGM36313.1 hypothetical protein K734_07250 [Idiomarina loihiensis GSL 199]